MAGAEDAPTKLDIRGLIAAIGAISVAAIGFGHSLPLFSILLHSYGASDSTIGLNAGTAAISSLALIPFFPRIIAKVGVKQFLLACFALLTLCYFGFYLADGRIWAWFPLRFVLGFAGSGLFVASEIWISAVAPPHIRGRIIGIYGTFLAIGFALGPLLIDLFGTTGFTPFGVAMAIFVLAMAPVLSAAEPQAEATPAKGGFFALLTLAPATFLASAIFSGSEAAILTFLPIHAIEMGWSGEVGARAVTVYGFGIVALQYLIGRYAENIGYGRTLLGCAVVSLLGAFLFAGLSSYQAPLFALLFVWGGFLAGLYTVGLILIGDRFEPEQYTSVNTGFVFMYSIGSLFVPVLAGASRQYGGQSGLEIFLIVMLGVYALLVAARFRRRRP